jgi:hypothetical protein
MTRLTARLALAAAPALVLGLAGPALAQKQILKDRPVTMETLLDRIQIEDFIAPPPTPSAGYRRGGMLLTNPIINVEGNVATAHVIWTGIMNEGVGKAPSLYEQGREYTELRKVKGKWMISRRFISSDSGLPDRFDATWKPREHR